MKKVFLLVAAAALMAACTPKKQSTLDPTAFQEEVNGKQTNLYTLTNSQGMRVDITNFGGRIVSIMVPDRNGNMQDVVLGFDNVKDYETIPSDFGACIGRYANRINQGKITLNGMEYQLATNNFGHTLHGGPTGWQYQVYEAEQVDAQTLKLTIVSPDGDNGFPGEVTASCTYTLTEENELKMEYAATTTAPTVINMTNHSYFNLNGNGNLDILDNVLWLNAQKMTPVDNTFMTTGEIVDIPQGDPFDFYTAPKPVGQDINADNEQLTNGNGYDHNWVLNPTDETMNLAAALYSPLTGIRLDVLTNEPGIQVYAGNFLDGSVTGKYGKVYGQRHAICLETQKYPDTPNKPEWPSALLNPGETYQSTTVFKFSVEPIHESEEIFFADPTIYVEDGVYYLTGTRNTEPLGFALLQSIDLKHWTVRQGKPNENLILTCGSNTYGTKGFWAPQIYKENGKYYYFYTANEQICMAVADNIYGPYLQDEVQAIDDSRKNIDPFLFKDEDGKYYLYHVRFDHGNILWVGEFDLSTGKFVEGTLHEVLRQSEYWEMTENFKSAPIMEGPTVFKKDGLYYMIYSANHFLNIDYAVGYATAENPNGPWTKCSDSPFIHRSIVGENGSGHGDLFYGNDGQAYYVYHVHHNAEQATPRRTRIVPVEMTKKGKAYQIKADAESIITPLIIK